MLSLMTDTQFDWSTVNWWAPDVDDPRRYHKGYRSWTYYASPTMAHKGKHYAPREFRCGTAEMARKIIAASPEGRGTITFWSEREQRRIVIEAVRGG